MCVIIPIKIYDNFTNYENFRSDLHRLGGMRDNPILKKINQYFSYSKDLYHRLIFIAYFKERYSSSNLSEV
jgi:hypothetical protein